MEESIKHVNKLARDAVVDIYLSGGNGRFYWPDRLQPAIPGDSTPSVRESCHHYILDSGFRDGGVPAEQLVEMTHDRQPDYVIPNDTVNTPDVEMRTAIEETAEKVAQFLDLIDEQTFPATVLVPLQPPHDFHYAFLHEHYPRQARRGHFALGGMKNTSPEEQTELIKQFRRVAGYQPYVHGFGLGASRQLIHALRDDPALLDSVDFSTPQKHANSARVAGNARVPVYIGTTSGKNLSTTTSNLIAAELTEIARMLDPSIPDENLEIDWKKFKSEHERMGRRLERHGVLDDEPESAETSPEQAGLKEFATQPE